MLNAAMAFGLPSLEKLPTDWLPPPFYMVRGVHIWEPLVDPSAGLGGSFVHGVNLWGPRVVPNPPPKPPPPVASVVCADTPTNAATEAPAPAEPAAGTLPRLAAIYGPVVATLANLEAIIDNPKATVEDKLAELSRHAPIPDELTAEQIAKALGVHKSTIARTNWWRSRQSRLDAERSRRRDARRGDLD
jgi:hypothetical protein